jgi:hypothetical protein
MESYVHLAMPAAGSLSLMATDEKPVAQLPPSKNAPKPGELAPDFTLADSMGEPQKLSALLFGFGGGQ